MSIHSRRDFLAATAATAGALALGSDRVFAEDKATQMAIARWTGEKPADSAKVDAAAVKLVEQAMAALGGMGRFVKKNFVVWVKPNIGWDRTPEQAANTNPAVVETIVRLCFEAGAKAVRVGDNTVNVAAKCYESSGIAAAAKKAGAEVVFMDRSNFRDMDIRGEKVKQHPVFPGIVECDLVVNCPVVKHHALATSTLCMKNFMGVIEKRQVFHQNIPACLCDLTRFLKPQINILDAVRILKAHGPKGGDLADVETPLTLAAGVDIVAMDAWGAQIMHKNPEEIGSIVEAQKGGIGKMDYKSLALKELSVQ